MHPKSQPQSQSQSRSHSIIRSLTAGHRNMERVLTLVRLKLDTLHGSKDEVDFQLLSNAIGYMQNYPGVSHHPTEDVIISKLLGYASENRGRFSQISDQHQRFSRWEVTLLQKLRDAQAGDAVACREAQELGKTYCAEQASHIHNEEAELFPRALQWLSDADWETVEDHSRSALDPVFARKELQRFDTLHDYLMAAPAEPQAAG